MTKRAEGDRQRTEREALDRGERFRVVWRHIFHGREPASFPPLHFATLQEAEAKRDAIHARQRASFGSRAQPGTVEVWIEHYAGGNPKPARKAKRKDAPRRDHDALVAQKFLDALRRSEDQAWESDPPRWEAIGGSKRECAVGPNPLGFNPPAKRRRR